MLNQVHKLNNLSEQSVSGANESSNYLDKISSITCVNDFSRNILLIDRINTLNAELNPISHLLALLGVHFLHVSRIRVKSLTLRLLMSYIYI